MKIKSLILMVEDEEQVLNTNCRMLRRRGYDVRTAQTVSESLSSAWKNSCRIFSSWTLCFRTETAWISAATSAKKTMETLFFFLTGKSDIRDKVEGLQQGGDYYLTKPL